MTSPTTARRKWVVAFQGGRDDYQVAIALEERNALEVLVTDWYLPLDRAWFRIVARLLPSQIRRAFARRFRPRLPSRRVRALNWLSAMHVLKRTGAGATDAAIGRVAGRIAKRRGLGVLAYSYFAHTAFPEVGKSLPKLIFQLHPHPDSLRALFTEEMRLVPECRESLGSEIEMVTTSSRLAELRSEPAAADACLVASRFTMRTLVENGIAEDRIRVVAYGVDLERFPYSAGPGPSAPFRVLFVGQMVQRKGLKYLLDAWKELALPNSELVLAGRGRADNALLERYAGLCRIESNVDESRLRDLYAESDIFCMPSLAEGFGLVYLEAMASGTPVIGSRNSGAADVITEGQDGFVLDIRDVDGLRRRLSWCHANRAAVRAMRPRVRQTAELYTWERFRSGVAEAIDELFAGDGTPLSSIAGQEGGTVARGTGLPMGERSGAGDA